MKDRIKLARELMTIATEIEAMVENIEIWKNGIELEAFSLLSKEQLEEKIERDKQKLASLNILFDMKATSIHNEVTENDFIRERVIDSDNLDFSGYLNNKEK